MSFLQNHFISLDAGDRGERSVFPGLLVVKLALVQPSATPG